MPAPRRKRLPTDFFDRLLSNQTDDQMNDLLSSLVDEQIAPTADVMVEESPRPAPQGAPVKKYPKEYHRDKIEDSIVTRDESLDDLSGLAGEGGGDIIPRSARMAAAGMVMPPVMEPKPRREPGQVPGREETGRETPQRPGVSRLVEQAGAALPGADFTVPEELIQDIPSDQVVEAAKPAVPWVDLTASIEAPVAPRPRPMENREAPAAEPVAEESFPAEPGGKLLHEELRRQRRSVRWQRPPLRNPKMPKLAVPTPPITFKPPVGKVDLGISFDRLLKTRVRRTSKAALLFLLPAFVGFSLFSWYPMIKGFVISLFNYAPLGTSTFVGWANYVRAFHDAMFWRTLMHAGGFCVLALALGFWLPILLSILINELRWGKGAFKFLFFLPFLMPTVPAAILWKWLLDQGFGLVNAMVSLLGGSPHIGWLTSPHLALLSVVMLYIWKNTGWAILIYSAALTSIDETLYEEAELDGAGIWSKIRHITLPSIRSVTGVMLIITIINTLQIFTEVFILTNGGPLNSTEVIATYIYKQAFFYMDIGYASALSFILLVMLLFITVFRLRRLGPEGD